MNFYLDRYGFQAPKITETPQDNLSLIIVIPCFNEPDLIQSLEAILACELPKGKSIEVITVINAGVHHDESIKEHNQETYEQALKWAAAINTPALTFYFILEDSLPKKHAGVGLARKIGMDEAVARFEWVGKDGIIICFDADATCTPNYLIEIERHFREHPKTPGCSIHYEHPIEGEVFADEIYQGIINYELHLRYYNQCLRFANLPYAFHTVGSSMAVRSSAYQKQGGMNKRKAGEDFYFIHKIIALGHFTELKTTMVIPSPRTSDRVPFGTGKAIGDWIAAGEDFYKTYAFKSFEIIKAFVAVIPSLQEKELADCQINSEEQGKKLLVDFLKSIDFDKALADIRKNSTTLASFKKRFFQWFDAFKILKAVHFFRDQGYDNQPVLNETQLLFDSTGVEDMFENERAQLRYLRLLESK